MPVYRAKRWISLEGPNLFPKLTCTEACSAASTIERGITSTPNMPMYMAHCASQVVATSSVVHSKEGTKVGEKRVRSGVGVVKRVGTKRGGEKRVV